MNIQKFNLLVEDVVNELKSENYKTIFRSYQGSALFLILVNKERKSIIRAVINDLLEYAVFSENGKIKKEISNETTLHQY